MGNGEQAVETREVACMGCWMDSERMPVLAGICIKMKENSETVLNN